MLLSRIELVRGKWIIFIPYYVCLKFQGSDNGNERPHVKNFSDAQL